MYERCACWPAEASPRLRLFGVPMHLCGSQQPRPPRPGNQQSQVGRRVPLLWTECAELLPLRVERTRTVPAGARPALDAPVQTQRGDRCDLLRDVNGWAEKQNATYPKHEHGVCRCCFVEKVFRQVQRPQARKAKQSVGKRGHGLIAQVQTLQGQGANVEHGRRGL